MKLVNTPIVVTGVANSPPIPADTRANPINIGGSITDGGVSTYQLQYTTSDVFAPGYVSATDPMWTVIPTAPTTGTFPFNITGLSLTAIRLHVTTGPATVTINQVFQADSSVGA
jgi:hypothetical protein